MNLGGALAPEHVVYPDLLAQAGYVVGHSSKGWGPGDWRVLGRSTDPAGPKFKSFASFLAERPAGKPFCFWLGSTDPHRPYEAGSGARAGIDPSRVRVPVDLPDCDVARSDLADYLLEVQRFDRDVGAALDLLEQAGLLDDTIVVTSDHGMPFPRHKCHVYDSGTRVPLAVRWAGRVKPGRRIDDFVSLADLAPTFLEAAGAAVPTKRWLVERRDEPDARRFFDLAFGKRPAEELYELAADPQQLVNLAADPAHAAVKAELARRLDEALDATGDQRAAGRGAEFEAHPYYGATATER